MPWDFSDADRKDAMLAKRLSDLSPAMARIERNVEEAIARRFDEQSDGSSPWAHLAPSTVKDRARRGYGPTPILQRTGNLRRSVQGRHDRQSAEVGPRVAYAGFHADGTTKIPKRDFLVLTEAEIVALEVLLVGHLDERGG